jgi:DNA mismatch repair protein MutS
MTETATILHHATPRSLVILDEIGRGTSTYDGLAIAQAVVEYIHGHPGLGCRTLFATHYHELTALPGSLPRVRNFHVEVLEEAGAVVFLHRVAPGAARRSYGIEVAKLAGIPKPVTRRPEDILSGLEAAPRGRTARRVPAGVQMPLFQAPDPVVDELRSVDVLALSPLEALTKLCELAEAARSRPTG